ncbi:17095_t:CDS:2, partial [Gigaspora rosea]
NQLNALYRVSEGSENALVEIIARIIDMVMFNLPVDYEVDVTRRDKIYIPVVKAKIPLNNESFEEVEEFVHALLILQENLRPQNGVIVNLQSIVNSFQKNRGKR